jgi:hypothetical protein
LDLLSGIAFARAMDRFFPQQSSGSAAVSLAERLLAEAEACPALTRRTDPTADVAAVASERFPALSLLSDPVLDARPYLEHLVSIAVAAANRSEMLAKDARRQSRRARRQMLAVGCFGSAALLIAIGFAALVTSDNRVAQLRSQVIALTEQQQQAKAEIAALAGAKDATTRPEPATASARAAPATPVATQPAMQAPNIRYYAQPWPDSGSALRRNAFTPSQPMTGPRLFGGFERRIQAVLR